jgi:hypothetical protein
MDQQTWIITFDSDSDDVDYQANTLEEFLLNASSDIEAVQKPRNEYAQGGWTDILVTIVTSSAAVAAINAISMWIKSTHGAAIDIEIKGTKVKARNITSKNYEDTLREVLKHAQGNSGKNKAP